MRAKITQAKIDAKSNLESSFVDIEGMVENKGMLVHTGRTSITDVIDFIDKAGITKPEIAVIHDRIMIQGKTKDGLGVQIIGMGSLK